jgi:hypothetical protein
MVEDPEVRAIGYTFLIDLIIFLLYVLLFFAIRGSRGDQNEVLPNWRRMTRELREKAFSDQDLRASRSEEDIRLP